MLLEIQNVKIFAVLVLPVVQEKLKLEKAQTQDRESIWANRLNLKKNIKKLHIF